MSRLRIANELSANIDAAIEMVDAKTYRDYNDVMSKVTKAIKKAKKASDKGNKSEVTRYCNEAISALTEFKHYLAQMPDSEVNKYTPDIKGAIKIVLVTLIMCLGLGGGRVLWEGKKLDKDYRMMNAAVDEINHNIKMIIPPRIGETRDELSERIKRVEAGLQRAVDREIDKYDKRFDAAANKAALSSGVIAGVIVSVSMALNILKRKKLDKNSIIKSIDVTIDAINETKKAYGTIDLGDENILSASIYESLCEDGSFFKGCSSIGMDDSEIVELYNILY